MTDEKKTAPEPIRDPRADHLLTPENCALLLIDYQPEQYDLVTSTTKERINLNLEALGKLASAYEVPTVLSTVAVDMGVNKPMVKEVTRYFPDVEPIDRTGLNAWEDADVRAAVERTGRRKIVVAGLWTEICVAYPVLDLCHEGYEAYFVADAIGDISPVAHERAMRRMEMAGAVPLTALQFGAELMRNWARPDADKFRDVFHWYFPAKAKLDKAGKE